MTKSQSVVSTEEKVKAQSLLSKHFPNYDWTDREHEFDADFVSKAWLTAGSLVEAVDKKTVERRLKNIECLINELWREFHALPLKVRGHESEDLWRRIMSINHDLTGQTPFVSTSNDVQSVYDSAMPRKKGFIRVMQERVNAFFAMHHNARDAEFAAKVQLSRNAADLWNKYKNQNPPIKPAHGTSYYNFVADLIQFAEKDWSVDATVRAYRSFIEDTDR